MIKQYKIDSVRKLLNSIEELGKLENNYKYFIEQDKTMSSKQMKQFLHRLEKIEKELRNVNNMIDGDGKITGMVLFDETK